MRMPKVLCVTMFALTQAFSQVAGSGTTNYVPVWTNTTTLGNSALYSNAGNVGIGTSTPANPLDVNGNGRFTGTLSVPNINNARWIDGTTFVRSAAGINSADQNIGSGAGVIYAVGDITATDAEISIGQNHSLVICGSLTVSSPILLSQYARLTGCTNGGAQVVASQNRISLVRGTKQDATQEAFYVDHIALNGNGKAFSTAVLDMTGAFVPTDIEDLTILAYNTGWGIYMANSTTNDGGGPILFHNIWIDAGVGTSSSGCLSVQHDSTTALYMQGYKFDHIWCENVNSAANAIQISDIYPAGGGYLRDIEFDNVYFAGCSGTAININGGTLMRFSQITSGCTSSPAINITNSSNNADFSFENIYNLNGVACTINDAPNSRCLAGNIARYVYTPPGAPNDLSSYHSDPSTFYSNVTIQGNLSVAGVKNFVTPDPTDARREIAFVSLEGPEAGTYCRGSAKLTATRVRIKLPQSFALVTSSAGVTAQVTPNGPGLGLYISKKSSNEITIACNLGAKCPKKFDWLVQGIRRGYEDYQPIRQK